MCLPQTGIVQPVLCHNEPTYICLSQLTRLCLSHLAKFYKYSVTTGLHICICQTWQSSTSPLSQPSDPYVSVTNDIVLPVLCQMVQFYQSSVTKQQYVSATDGNSTTSSLSQRTHLSLSVTIDPSVSITLGKVLPVLCHHGPTYLYLSHLVEFYRPLPQPSDPYVSVTNAIALPVFCHNEPTHVRPSHMIQFYQSSVTKEQTHLCLSHSASSLSQPTHLCLSHLIQYYQSCHNDPTHACLSHLIQDQQSSVTTDPSVSVTLDIVLPVPAVSVTWYTVFWCPPQPHAGVVWVICCDNQAHRHVRHQHHQHGPVRLFRI